MLVKEHHYFGADQVDRTQTTLELSMIADIVARRRSTLKEARDNILSTMQSKN